MRVHTQVRPLSTVVDTGIWTVAVLFDFRTTDLGCRHNHILPQEAFVCRRGLKQYWDNAAARKDFVVADMGDGKMEARWDLDTTTGRYANVRGFKWLDN